MENASKALIIAGAILISIVLVSVGVLVVQQLNPEEALSSMTEQEVQTFNSKFENSCGTNKTGTTAKGLISTIQTNNGQNAGNNEKIVKVTTGGSETTALTDAQISTLRNKINSSARYNITDTKNPNSGKITSIDISTSAGAAIPLT